MVWSLISSKAARPEPLPLGALPLTGTIGVLIPEANLRRIGANEIDQLAQLTSEWCVSVIPGQFLTPPELAAFGERLGSLTMTPGLKANTEWPFIQRVENRGKKSAGTEHWHTDASFAAEPAAYTMLSASVLPAAGGDTLFVNQYESYERMSVGMKRALGGLQVEHFNADVPLGVGRPSHVHPLVRRHLVTGRSALFVNVPRSMGSIENFSEAESRNLIEFLYNGSLSIDRMYRHRWSPGDVVIWDNRCTLHAAAHDYGDQARTLYRVMTAGEEPVQADI